MKCTGACAAGADINTEKDRPGRAGGGGGHLEKDGGGALTAGVIGGG